MPKTAPPPRQDDSVAPGNAPPHRSDTPETLDLPALIDISLAGQLHEAARAWLAARAQMDGGRIVLADPDNALSLQIAIATAKSGIAAGLQIDLTGPDGPLPREIRLGTEAAT